MQRYLEVFGYVEAITYYNTASMMIYLYSISHIIRIDKWIITSFPHTRGAKLWMNMNLSIQLRWYRYLYSNIYVRSIFYIFIHSSFLHLDQVSTVIPYIPIVSIMPSAINVIISCTYGYYLFYLPELPLFPSSCSYFNAV